MPTRESEANRRWREKNRTKYLENQRRWRAENKEILKQKQIARDVANGDKVKLKRREWREKNIERVRDVARGYKYGLARGAFDAKLIEQGGRCAICRHDQPRGRNWHVDHCHITGVFRGVLCKGCNTALGAFGDTVAGLQRAVNYLKQFENISSVEDDSFVR